MAREDLLKCCFEKELFSELSAEKFDNGKEFIVFKSIFY